MIPAFLIRACIDFVRHNEEFKDSNPYSRCEQAIKTCQTVWEEQIGKADLYLLEPATIAAYWSEFFHAEDPLADEVEWRDGLIKQSGTFDNFEDWQESFKKTYAKVYKEDNIWLGVLMTAWAHTHQYEVVFAEDSWEFRPATSYLPTSEMWRLEPHMCTISEVMQEIWWDESRVYQDKGFQMEETSAPYMGRVECLGFDRKKYVVYWPPGAQKDKETIDIGEMIADIILPAGDDWYRHLDNVIFADDFMDVTALISRTKYILGSKRRLLELSIDNDDEKAKVRAAAEGWLVPKPEEALV
jgi:hypothetical protein